MTNSDDTPVLLRDVIDIPERAGSDDYVLKLTDSTDGDADIQSALDAYVLTESLEQNFAQALDLVADAVAKNTSRAAFLTGSFGSGKSHFMAVLYALLGNHPAMRSEKFTALTGRYDKNLAGKNILRLTYHLIGARSMEEAIFGGYIRQIRRLHPDCDLPALHVTDTMLRDAENLRTRMGDEKFFAELGGGTGGDSGWGDFGASGWTAEDYAAALAAAPEDPERKRLVTALVDTYFQAFADSTDYVSLDRGLAEMSAHAKTLGYDAVLLFLDELVLWLIFAVRDTEFFGREAQKLTKLVEDEGNARPIPLVSLVSRQMDLRKWFADAGSSGAEQDAIDRAFQYQEGRFTQIQLGDDNLAQVAHARLLRPKNAEAAAILQKAFTRVSRSAEVWDVLRNSMNNPDDRGGASESEFQLTYPFSPALVATLRNLSSVMQRERTALKVMQRMLVDRRDTLTVDDLIPVGDVFDYVVEGSQPIDQHAGNIFSAADELFTEKLLPVLCQTHQVDPKLFAAATETDKRWRLRADLPTGFVTHERIAKTLLLSAIAPKVPALQNITARRMAALNHGSIRARLRGGEARLVLGAVRTWADSAVPEISIGDGDNPIISIKLADVDYESILDRINAEDNQGRRRVLLRRMIHEALGVSGDDDLTGAASRTLVWRGSTREVDVVFGNVRDAASVPESTFDARPGTWRFIVDYPFDEAGYSTADDLARLDRLIAFGDRQTIAWLPGFFTDEDMNDLALLVKLDWLFASGDRWLTNSDHLSVGDRAQARGILENLLQGKRTGLRTRLRQVYGIGAGQPAGEDQRAQLVSLQADFQAKFPVTTTLGEALEKIAGQAFAATYPDHPHFDPESEAITVRQLQTVRDYVEQAVAHRDGRVPTHAGADRTAVRRVSGPLRVGRATEDHFLFGADTFAYWAGELDRAEADNGEHRLTVGVLAEHIGAIEPAWGLEPAARDLVISAWALLRGRAWFENGSAIAPPKIGTLKAHLELRAEQLPEAAAWEKARYTASALFGYTITTTVLTGANVADFAEHIRARAKDLSGPVRSLADRLGAACVRLGIDQQEAERPVLTRLLAEQLAALSTAADNVALIDRLAGLDLPVAPETAARLLTEAPGDGAALGGLRWMVVDRALDVQDHVGRRPEEARKILGRLRAALSGIGAPLADGLAAATDELITWLAGSDGTEDPDGTGGDEGGGDQVGGGGTGAHDPGPGGDTDPDVSVVVEPRGAYPTRTNPEEIVIDVDTVSSVEKQLRAALRTHGKKVRIQWWVEE